VPVLPLTQNCSSPACAYVTNVGSGTVSVIDEATNTVTATIPVGSSPYAVAVDPGTHTAYVTNNSSNTVSVISVGLGSQTITFTSTAPSGAVVGGPAYPVTATGGASGNPVTFSLDASSTSGCALSGSTVSFGGPAGTCVVDANQAGNTSYSAEAWTGRHRNGPSGTPWHVLSVADLCGYTFLSEMPVPAPSESHVTPVTGCVAHREQHRHISRAGLSERLLAPFLPVDRVCGVLEQVGARRVREAVSHHVCLCGWSKSVPWGRVQTR
jgi:YVTN family beta-propeller protein